jgi:hypothetical protein
VRVVRCVARCVAALALVVNEAAHAQAADAVGTSVTLGGFHYAMRDEPDFGVYVAAVQHGAFRVEARHNYEARGATSVFAGRAWTGGDAVAWSVTPLLGGLFGNAKGVVPAVEASVAWRAVDLYVEAEYVRDLDDRDASFFYAWTELGWRPVEALRIGLVGQRTRIVTNDRDLQRGIFGQVTFGAATVGLYAFNPEAASRYVIVSLALTL